MRISIFAAIGSQNLGDELILKNEIESFRQQCGENTKFDVFSYDPSNPFYSHPGITYKEYFPIGSRRIKNIGKNIINFFSTIISVIRADLVVIGGGGIFYDSEKQATKDPLDQWLFRTHLCKLLKKKVLFHAVGIDVKKQHSLPKIQKIFSIPGEVTVRDKESHSLLDSLGISSKVIEDPVFQDNKNHKKTGKCLGVISADTFRLDSLKNLDFSGKTVGIAVRSGYIHNEVENIHAMIDLIEEKGGSVALLIHSFHKIDAEANDLIFLAQFHKKRRRVTTSLEDTYNVYKNKEIDMCISMRFHSMILSQVYGIDYVGISYAEKTKQLLKK